MIGGNVLGLLQQRTRTGRNTIGETSVAWQTIHVLKGWLDFSSGSSDYAKFKAKIQESTHLFVGDYVELNPEIKAENSRLVVAGQTYDILLIDNPMELNKQLEIYLKYTGG